MSMLDGKELETASERDPVHYVEVETVSEWGGVEKPGWYFWDESWANRLGPYESKEEAEKMLNKYCDEVLGLG